MLLYIYYYTYMSYYLHTRHIFVQSIVVSIFVNPRLYHTLPKVYKPWTKLRDGETMENHGKPLKTRRVHRSVPTKRWLLPYLNIARASELSIYTHKIAIRIEYNLGVPVYCIFTQTNGTAAPKDQ